MGLRARVWPGLRTRGVWLEVVLAVLPAAAAAGGAATGDRGVVPVWLFAVLDAAVLALLLVLRRRAPFPAFVAVAVLTVLSPALDAGLTVLAYAVGRYVGRWQPRIVTAALGFVVVTHLWTGGDVGAQVSQVIGFLVLLVLPGAVGALVRTRALLLQALRDRAEKAEAERELLARDAVLTERTRIAREMHDAVGHRVSLMVLQAGAIEMAAADRQRVAQLAGQVQTAGRQALDELRQTVGVLRAEDAEEAPRAPQPGLGDLPALVDSCRAAGMAVALTMPPEGSSPVDAAAGRAAYRVVQEALTNAGKHAPGAAVQVVVERPAGELALRVVNGAPSRPADADVPGGGYGLVGLGERVRTLGGRLHAGPRLDGGFEVVAVLPS
jgi:signal transduction histidine kinase